MPRWLQTANNPPYNTGCKLVFELFVALCLKQASNSLLIFGTTGFLGGILSFFFWLDLWRCILFLFLARTSNFRPRIFFCDFGRAWGGHLCIIFTGRASWWLGLLGLVRRTGFCHLRSGLSILLTFCLRSPIFRFSFSSFVLIATTRCRNSFG